MLAGYVITVLSVIAQVLLSLTHFGQASGYLLIVVTVVFGWAALRALIVMIVLFVRDVPTLKEVASLVAVMVFSVFGYFIAVVVLGTFSDAFPK